ncbi:MAG: transposase zinc-binding domain-containing protein [Chloroflexi bacterium]|nr:transposase zinc-binding domain-containing protein [Chloroflexota bacterium]
MLRTGNWLDTCRRQHPLSYQQTKAVNDILRCRTAALGGYLKQCDSCGQWEIAYCACKNRHCPGCGHFEKAQWLEKQKALLLPCPYYQVVFTIDHVFNPLVRYNQKLLYDLLFQTAARLLKTYGEKYLKGKIGFTIVLHTWGQTIQFHPHIHCMVTGGALVKTKAGGRWRSAHKKYLFPVVALSADFRRAFCQGVRELAQQGKLAWDAAAMGQTIEEMVTAALRQNWEVYIEAPPKGADNRSPETLAEYLGRYRTLSPSATTASAHRARGRHLPLPRQSGRRVEKEMTLPGLEFIRRFAARAAPIALYASAITGCTTARRKPSDDKRGRCWALAGRCQSRPNYICWIGWRHFWRKTRICARIAARGQMRTVREFGPVKGWRGFLARLVGIPGRARPAPV